MSGQVRSGWVQASPLAAVRLQNIGRSGYPKSRMVNGKSGRADARHTGLAAKR